MAVTNVAELNALVERVKKAQREYASFTQEQVDKIFRAAALAAADADFNCYLQIADQPEDP